MGFKGLITAVTSVAMIAAPTIATAQTTATTASARSEIAPATESVDGDQLRGGWVIPLIALIAVILGLCVATDLCGGDDDDPPTSP